jgi:hypothetical protein
LGCRNLSSFLHMNVEPASYRWQNLHSVTWRLKTRIVEPE